MKKNKETRGISLIVLVITIVVMIIIAGVVIASLSESKIVDKSTNAVQAANLKNALDIAKKEWAKAYASGVRTKEGLESAVMEGLEKADSDLIKYKITVTTKGVKVEEPEDESVLLNPINIIPEGATYIAANGVTYNAGDKFPDVMMPLDRYDFGDYVYVYQAAWGPAEPNSGAEFANQFHENTSYDGWRVTTFGKDKKTVYGTVLESINGKNVISMAHTFRNNRVIEVAPLIPKNINEVYSLFYNCPNLKQVPEGFSIPLSVTSCTEMFFVCSSLEKLPTSFVIHENITSINFMFAGCTNLRGNITIDTNPKKYDIFLGGCDTSKITIVGKTTMKNELLATGN